MGNCQVNPTDIQNALKTAGVPVNDNVNNNNYNNVNGLNYQQFINDITSCDARCQEQNRTNELLRLKYVDAKNNVITAPSKRDVSEKDYYTTAFGEGEYNQILSDKYNAEIKKTTDEEKVNFNSQKENLSLVLENFDKNIDLNTRLNELIEITLIENNEFIEKIDAINSTIDTNERKTYYNEQQINDLIKWKTYTMRYLFFIYIVLFVMIVMLNRTELNYKLIIKFFILMLIPLLLIPIVTRTILTFYNWITKDSSEMSPVQLLTKIMLESGDEMKIFFGVFYAPIELFAL
jgi:hypothetical protein